MNESAGHAETGPPADKEWRDGWDAIEAPWGLIARQVPLIAVHAARKSLPARHAALTQRRPPVSRPGSSRAGPPRKIAQRISMRCGLIFPDHRTLTSEQKDRKEGRDGKE